METLIGEEYHEPMFNDASQHGLVWATLNELLHVIMFIYTLFGLIQFPVKFIKRRELVDSGSKLFILHNCYLFAKFALVSFLCFLFNMKLDKYSIEMRSLNCMLANYKPILEARLNRTANATTSERTIEYEGLISMKSSAVMSSLMSLYELLPDVGELLDSFGGPFRLLDNRATLLYGLWAISTYFTLALFPLELMFSIDVGYNFIRFVLSDPSCMVDLYERRDKHLLRLASWSRLRADSLLTKGAKMILSQRDLRSNYAAQHNANPSHLKPANLLVPPSTRAGKQRELASSNFHLELFPEQLIGDLSGEPAGNNNEKVKRRARLWRLASIGAALKSWVAPATSLNDVWRRIARINHFGTDDNEEKLRVTAHAVARHHFNGVKRLKTRLAINHLDRPSYRVCVANRNLKRFKPFVRSEAWFKASMIIYPMFITIYMVFFMVSLCLTESFLEYSLWDILRNCKQQQWQQQQQGNEATNSMDSIEQQPAISDWSLWDKLIYYETLYAVLLLSCASSFYCSYYFGTIYELHVWIRELSQQLELSAHVIELTDVLTHSNLLNPIQVRRHLAPLLSVGLSSGHDYQQSDDQSNVCFFVNDFGGLKELAPGLRDLMRKYSKLFSFNWLWSAKNEHRRNDPTHFNRFVGPISKYRHREQLAIRLLTKKETLLRATYVNMCLFFDELNETRVMTTIILRRFTHISAGFAIMLSITRSQYKLNSGEYWYLSSWLLGVLLVFNLCITSAASINNGINRMLVKIHSLVVASIKTGSEDADLFEFWLRHVNSFGEDKDVTAYCIYGYKITWSTIINFDSLIVTLFFLTI